MSICLSSSNNVRTAKFQRGQTGTVQSQSERVSTSCHHSVQLSTSWPRQKTSKVTENTNITKNLSHAEARNSQTFAIGKARDESGNYDVGSCNPTPRLQRSDCQRQSTTFVCICASRFSATAVEKRWICFCGQLRSDPSRRTSEEDAARTLVD